MKAITLLALFISSFSSAQFNQTWMHDRIHNTAIEDSYMRIVENTIYIHPKVNESCCVQPAQSISTDGVENWYMVHDQINACTNCGLQGVESVDISSTGDAYGVGFQPSSPYGGRYIYKTDNQGQLMYAEEYFTTTFSGEFNDVKLSADESLLFVFGEKYAAEFNTIVPHLFKINPDNGQILSEVQIAPYGWVFPKKMEVDAFDNIYLNASNVDTMRFSSFNSNLELRWTDFVVFPGYVGSGRIETFIYANGDVLFSTELNNSENSKRLFLTRYSSSGSIIWQQTINFIDYSDADRIFRDAILDPLGNVYYYYAHISGGFVGPTINPEDEQVDALRNESNFESSTKPEVFSIDPQGQVRYHYIYPGVGNEIYAEYPKRIIADENGYLIGSSVGDQLFPGVAHFLLTPQGELQSEIRLNLNPGATIYGMVYEGNKVFYTHGAGTRPEQTEELKWLTARYQYDYTTGFHALETSKLAIYPNPVGSHEWLNISGLEKGYPVQLFSANGKLVSNLSSTSSDILQLNTNTFSEGLYLLKNGRNQIRFVVTR